MLWLMEMDRGKVRALVARAVKFGVVGVGATVIHCAMVILLVQGPAWDPVAATVPAFILAFLFSYRLNHGWTFQASGRHRRHLIRFAAVTLGVLACNLAIMHILVERLGYSYLVALGVVIIVMPLVSFVLNAQWAFR